MKSEATVQLEETVQLVETVQGDHEQWGFSSPVVPMPSHHTHQLEKAVNLLIPWNTKKLKICLKEFRVREIPMNIKTAYTGWDVRARTRLTAFQIILSTHNAASSAAPPLSDWLSIGMFKVRQREQLNVQVFNFRLNWMIFW